MSATQTPSPQAVQQSLGIIVSGVHKRAYLHKLAQLGHVPETEDEGDVLVALGFKLAAMDPSVQAPNPFLTQTPRPRGKYAEAADALEQVLGGQKQAADGGIFDAAVALAQDPQIYNAALTIKQAAAAGTQA